MRTLTAGPIKSICQDYYKIMVVVQSYRVGVHLDGGDLVAQNGELPLVGGGGDEEVTRFEAPKG